MALLTAAVAAGLWPWFRRDAGGLQFLGAALLLALAGYAWQGRKFTSGAPKAAQAEEPRPKSEFAIVRGDLLGPPDASTPILAAAEPHLALGQTEQAVDMLGDAVSRSPRDAKLWLGLADALVQHGDGQVSPAALLAYQRAAALNPNSPAPTFFYAINLANEGQRLANEGRLPDAAGRLGAADQIMQQLATSTEARWRELAVQVRENIGRVRSELAASAQSGP